MKFQIQISESLLKVVSGLFVNISAGLMLLLFTVTSILPFLLDLVFAILTLWIAKRIEDVLAEMSL